MDREFKFRGWDKVDGMKYFDFDDLKYGYKKIDHGVYDVPVMQFTGLKDKNGKEIYEGDILKTSNKSSELWHVDYKPSAFMVNQGNVNYDCVLSDFMDTETVEVIGNIYENPDLLK